MNTCTTQKECEICPLLVGQTAADDNVILQTERWVAVLDRNQCYLGKSFITLRQHKETLSDLDEADWMELHHVIRQLEQAVKEAFGADVCNWECLMNNAVKAGQPTHVHWHLHPRYLGGATFAGEEFPDPKWPRHLESAVHMVGDETFYEIMQALRSRLTRA
jgi:diadenosine tetraphosphate (ap4A) hydrolase and other HIT family hydrolases-like protein